MPLPGSFINALGVAVPDHAHSQHQLADFMANALQLDEPDHRRMMALYRQTKISRRYSVLADYSRSVGEFTFYPNSPNLEPLPSIGERMAVYQREALPLALRAVQACLTDYPTISLQSITHLVVVSCTGFYAPGPDIELIEALGLPGTTQRLLIGFMGCYGAFNGLKAADAIVRADPKANVLVVCVELCTIHFQKPENPSNWLANALFSDGAAAVLIQGTARRNQSFQLQSFHCDLLPEGRDQMAWTIGDHGFDMVLTSTIPDLIRHHINLMLQQILEQNDLMVADVDYFALHPGGRRILDLIELELGIDRSKTHHAYSVLNQYGNMSSATVLFVLKAIWDELAELATNAPETVTSGYSKRIAGVAFGPGLTLESMLLLAHVNPVKTIGNLEAEVPAEIEELIEL